MTAKWQYKQAYEAALVTARKLKSENAKLREQVVRWQDEWESERDYADQMEAREKKAVGENAKLRKLVKNLYECNGSCNRCVELMGKCEYEEQLRELGIEDYDD